MLVSLAAAWALAGAGLGATAQATTVFSDGFESGDTSAWTRVKSFSAQQTTVATGSWAGRAVSTGKPSWVWRNLGTNLSDAYLRARVHITTRSTAVWFAYARASDGPGIAAVGVNANGILIARNIVSGTNYAGGISVSAGVWHEVELHVLTGTNGRIDVWFDGQPVSTLSRSVNLGTAEVGRVMIGDGSSGRTFNVAFDDAVVSTARVGTNDITAPSTPTGLTATAVGSSQINLSWQPSTDDVRVAGYRVSRWNGLIYAAIGTTASTSFSNTGLSPETTYTYVVDAFDAAGNRSSPSQPASATTDARGATRPNFVVILTDDQPADSIDRMPTLQAEIVGKGVTFTSAIVSNSLCCPSRVSILRGQYSRTTGVYDNSSPFGGYSSFLGFELHRSTIGAWLDAAGYRTAYMGKVMNGYSGGAPLPGWDHWAGTGPGYYNYAINIDGVKSTMGADPSDYHTTVMMRLADRFIRESDAASPIFLQVAPYAPHSPFQPADAYAGDPRCSSATNTDAPSFNEKDVSDKPAYIQAKGGVSVQSIGIDRPIAQCETLLSVDDLIATVLDALEDTDRLSNTFFLYMSDNGLANGEHRWPNKLVPYEGAVKVPFVIRYDPVTQGIARVEDRLVANIDVAPTVMSVAGLNITPGCPEPPYGGICSGAFDGVSILPLLAAPVDPWRPDGVLLEHYSINVPTYCGIRTAAYKFVRYGTGEEELYDLVADPGEMVNMLKDGSISSTDQMLRDRFLDQLFGSGGWCVPAPPGYAPP